MEIAGTKWCQVLSGMLQVGRGTHAGSMPAFALLASFPDV